MTTTPFLGCKISLISKSEIRYEGILYTIDPKESTIALAKVKSFGTEDRPAERKVAPREEVFEYIIFRASDIKDLIVDDPPASIAPGLADPAIIQAHSTSTTTSGSSTFPSGTIPNIQSTTSQHQGQQSQGLSSFQSAFGAPPTHVSGVPVSYNTSGSIGSRSGNSTPTGNRGKSPHHDHTTGTSGVNITIGGRQTPKDNQQYRQQNRNQNQQNQRRLGGQTQRRQGGMMQQNYNRQPHNYSAQNRGSRPGNRYGSMTGGTGGGGNNVWGLYRRDPLRSRQPQQQRSNSRNRNRSKQRNKSQSENTLKIEGDYDFEKAHEEFVKMVKGMSNVKISDDGSSSNPNPQEEISEDKVVDSSNTDANTNDDSSQAKGDENKLEPCYDKTKSFFDKISCESLQKEKGEVQKVNWKQERQLNTETFGISQSKNGWRRPNSYRGRGYGYGSGGGRPGGHYRQNRGGRTGQGAENRRFIQRNRN